MLTLNYLPVLPATQIIHTDARGRLIAWMYNGIEIAKIEEYLEGALRAGHFHPDYDEIKIVCSGSIRTYMINPGTDQETITENRMGETVIIPRGWPHLHEGLDVISAFVVLGVSTYSSIDYPPYRDRVNEWLRQHQQSY